MVKIENEVKCNFFDFCIKQSNVGNLSFLSDDYVHEITKENVSVFAQLWNEENMDVEGEDVRVWEQNIGEFFYLSVDGKSVSKSDLMDIKDFDRFFRDANVVCDVEHNLYSKLLEYMEWHKEFKMTFPIDDILIWSLLKAYNAK